EVLSAGQNALRSTDQQQVRGTGGKKSNGHDPRDLVELTLQRHRIGNGETVDVQDVVAIVGQDAFTPHRPAATGEQLPGDEGARQRNHFDGQGKFTEGLDDLAVVDDAHEPPGCRGDDLLARQGAAAALDQVPRGGGFIGTIDIQI